MATIFSTIAERFKAGPSSPLLSDARNNQLPNFSSTPAITATPGEDAILPTGTTFDDSDGFAKRGIEVAKIIGGSIKAIGQAATQPESRKLFKKSFETGS